MRLTLKAINDELARRGYAARLARAGGYFYFQFGEAALWLDRTVSVPTLNSLTECGSHSGQISENLIEQAVEMLPNEEERCPRW